MAKLKGMFQRGNAWWLRYTPHHGAKQVRVSLGTAIEQVAAAKAMGILHRAPLEHAGEWAEEVDAYMEDMLDKGRLSRTFAPTRRMVLLAFARDCEVVRLSDYTLRQVERWIKLLQKGDGPKRRAVKPGTVEGYVFGLRAFGRWLVKRDKLRENPAAKVELGKVERVVRKNFVSGETVRMLIEAAPDDDLRFILYCGFHQGMRKLEIVEAAPQWFQLGVGKRRGRICIGQTPTFSPKDRDERTMPLTLEFERFLRGYLKRLPKGARWVLQPAKEPGKHRYRYDFRKPFEALMAAHGVQCMVHDMRRTFVSLKLIENSSLIFKLAKWTGDDVRVLQDHYGHLLADDEDIDVGL